MPYCSSCGSEVTAEQDICLRCGKMLKTIKPGGAMTASDDAKSGGWAFIGFLFPIIGIILHIAWKAQRPLKAGSVLKGAIIGLVLQFIGGFIYGFLDELGYLIALPLL